MNGERPKHFTTQFDKARNKDLPEKKQFSVSIFAIYKIPATL